jgi:Ca2+-binding EF-hand superfamily protein
MCDLPTEDAALFREAFESFDKNHDGLLSKTEFSEIFKKSGKEFTPKQINFYVKGSLLV